MVERLVKAKLWSFLCSHDLAKPHAEKIKRAWAKKNPKTYNISFIFSKSINQTFTYTNSSLNTCIYKIRTFPNIIDFDKHIVVTMNKSKSCNHRYVQNTLQKMPSDSASLWFTLEIRLHHRTTVQEEHEWLYSQFCLQQMTSIFHLSRNWSSSKMEEMICTVYIITACFPGLHQCVFVLKNVYKDQRSIV